MLYDSTDKWRKKASQTSPGQSGNHQSGNCAAPDYGYLTAEERMEITNRLCKVAENTPADEPCFLGTLNLPTKCMEPIAYSLSRYLKRRERKFFFLVNEYWPEGNMPTEKDFTYVYVYDPQAILLDMLSAAPYVTEFTLEEDGYTFRMCQRDITKLRQDAQKIQRKGEEPWELSVDYGEMVSLLKTSLQREKWTEEDITKEEEIFSKIFSRENSEGNCEMPKHEDFVRSMQELTRQDDQSQMFLRYRAAAERGKAWAFRELGRCSLNGVGTCVNEDIAFLYFEEAARRGDPRAWRCMAYCYGAGVGASLDLTKMQECLEKGAEEGDDEAQRLLGAWYMNMKPADCEEAGNWLKKAAEQGNEEAKEMLHVMYPVKEFMGRKADLEI